MSPFRADSGIVDVFRDARSLWTPATRGANGRRESPTSFVVASVAFVSASLGMGGDHLPSGGLCNSPFTLHVAARARSRDGGITPRDQPDDFARDVNRLVGVNVDLAVALCEIRHPMEPGLEDAENEAPRDEGHRPSVH